MGAPLVLLLALAVLPGQAQEAGAPAALSFGRAQCAALVRDNAAYVPGLDTAGRPVAPADIAGGFARPAAITVPVYGLYAWNRGGVVAAPLLAVATVRSDGQVLVDGEPLNPSDTGAAVERCRRMLTAGE